MPPTCLLLFWTIQAQRARQLKTRSLMGLTYGGRRQSVLGQGEKW